MTAQYEVHNIGPIEALRLEFEPGVNVIEGPNGAGKTTAISSIQRAHGGTVDLAPRDGTRKGSLRGPGVVLEVGRRSTAVGSPAVGMADYGAVHLLVDPGVKGEAAAERRRIEALVSMLDIEVDDAVVLRLAGGDTEVAAMVERKDPDLHSLAAEVRKCAQAIAREAEGRRDQAQGRAGGAKERIAHLTEGGDLTEPRADWVALEAELQDAIARATRLGDAAEARQRQEAERSRIAETLGDRPDLEAAGQACRQKRERVEDLRAQLRQAEDELVALEAEADGIQQAAERWDRAAELLKSPIEGPTAEEADAARRRVDDLRAECEEAKAWAEYSEGRREAERAERDAEIADERAVELRGIAAAIPQHLTGILSEQRLQNLVIDNGGDGGSERLCTIDEETGEVTPFQRLSLGQKVRYAIAAALSTHRRDANELALLPLDPGFWAALQPARQREVHDAATNAGVGLITEAPSDEAPVRVVRPYGAQS